MRLQAVRNRDWVLEIIDVGCNLKQFDGLTSTDPDPHVLRQIDATGYKAVICRRFTERASERAWCSLQQQQWLLVRSSLYHSLSLNILKQQQQKQTNKLTTLKRF